MATPTPIRLETSRLLLRRFEDRDLGTFYRYRNDPDVARYQGWDVPYSREDAEAMVKEMKIVPYGKPGRWVQLAIELKPVESDPDEAVSEKSAGANEFKFAGLKSEGGRNSGTLRNSGPLIGDVAFVILEKEPQQAEIGFTLDRAYQGQGYATEAVRRLLDELFGTFKLHRVRANIDPLNRASAHLLERLGFRLEAHMIESQSFKGHWADEDWYAILRREWFKQ